jgi:hypothetical protein
MTHPAGFDPIPVADYDALLLSTQEQFDKYWPATKPLVEKCIKRSMHGEITIDDIYALATQGKMYVFIVKSDKGIRPDVKLALVLEIVNYPRLPAINILALGGSDLDPLYDKFWKKLCGWAYMNGIRAIEGWVSPAMERVITRYGFKHVYTHMRFDLTENKL